MKPFLPSRLSFCLSPQRQQQLDAMIMANSCSSHASNSSDYPSSQKLINRSPMKVDNELESTEDRKEDIVSNEKAQVNIISPTKKLNYGGGHETTGGSGSSGCSLSTMVSVKRSPTVGFRFFNGVKSFLKEHFYDWASTFSRDAKKHIAGVNKRTTICYF